MPDLADLSPLAGCPKDIIWSDGPDLPSAQDHHTSFITSRGESAYLHVLGGANYQTFFKEHWVSKIKDDGSLSEWSKGADLPAAMAGQALAQVGDDIFLIGGRDALGFSAKVWMASFNDAGELTGWVDAPSLPAARFHSSAAVDGDTIIVSGGIDASGDAQRQIFMAKVDAQGSLGAWSTLEMPLPRSHHSSFTYRGELYLLLGFNGNPFKNQTVDYMGGAKINVQAVAQGQGAWEGFVSSPYGISTQATTVIEGCALRFGGLHIGELNALTYVASVDAIELEGDATSLSPLPSQLSVGRSHMHHAPHHRGFVYIVGGSKALKEVTPRVEIGRLSWD